MMELEQIIRALMGRINGPQMPSYAPGAQGGVPPLGGDEMFVGRPYPNEPLPQMGATPQPPRDMPWQDNRLGFVDMPVEAEYGPDHIARMLMQDQQPTDVMQQFQDMTFEGRERFLRGLNQGLSAEEAMQPEGFEPYDYFDRMSGYDMSGPERLYTVQAGGDFSDERLAEEGPPPTADEIAAMAESVGIDAETLRGLDLNATESRNFGYLLRMMEAENTIRELSGANTWGNRALEMLPGQAIESFFMDPDYRRLMLARENFNEAALRAATGATINQSEMPTQRQNYFPLPGDDEETQQLLERQRQALMMALMAGSGPAGAVVPNFGQPVVPRQTEAAATMRFNPATGQLEPIQ